MPTATPNSKTEPTVSLNVLNASRCGQAEQCCCSGLVSDASEPTVGVPNTLAHAAGSSLLSVLLSVGVAFFPKCPFCWAGYMSLLGVASLESLPYSPWLKPVMIGGLSVNLFVMYRMSKARQFHMPLYFTCAGTLSLLLHTDAGLLMPLGLGLITFGAVLNAVPVRRFLPLMFRQSELARG